MKRIKIGSTEVLPAAPVAPVVAPVNVLCVDGKPHSYKPLPPDGKDYNGQAFRNKIEMATHPNGEQYRKLTRVPAFPVLYCSKCADRKEMN